MRKIWKADMLTQLEDPWMLPSNAIPTAQRKMGLWPSHSERVCMPGVIRV